MRQIIYNRRLMGEYLTTVFRIRMIASIQSGVDRSQWEAMCLVSADHPRVLGNGPS
jgi:hypothetical protein